MKAKTINRLQNNVSELDGLFFLEFLTTALDAEADVDYWPSRCMRNAQICDIVVCMQTYKSMYTYVFIYAILICFNMFLLDTYEYVFAQLCSCYTLHCIMDLCI